MELCVLKHAVEGVFRTCVQVPRLQRVDVALLGHRAAVVHALVVESMRVLALPGWECQVAEVKCDGAEGSSSR